MVMSLLTFISAAYASKSKTFSPQTWTKKVILTTTLTSGLVGAGIGALDSTTFEPETDFATIPTSGVMTAGNVTIEVYWDVTATNPVSQIAWGVLDAGENATVQFWVKNEGTKDLYCWLVSDDWIPPEAGPYFDLTWDFGDTPVGKGRARKVTIELHVHTDITGIEDFSFNVIIWGSDVPGGAPV